MQQWVPKPTSYKAPDTDQEGFQPVRPRNKGKQPVVEGDQPAPYKPLSTSNGFDILAAQDAPTVEAEPAGHSSATDQDNSTTQLSTCLIEQHIVLETTNETALGAISHYSP